MKYISFLFMLLPMVAVTQNIDNKPKDNTKPYFISVGVDPRNLLWGSPKNDPGLDLVLKAGARKGDFQLAVFYENFDLIKYHSYGILPSVILKPFSDGFFKDVNLLAGGEISIVDRYGPTYLAYAFNSQVEYTFKKIIPDFFVFARADLKRRTDITQKWGYSNYIGVGYKF